MLRAHLTITERERKKEIMSVEEGKEKEGERKRGRKGGTGEGRNGRMEGGK